MLSWWEWVLGVAVLVVVIALRRVFVDYVLDGFSSPPTRWPPSRDGIERR